MSKTSEELVVKDPEFIEVIGANEHNLKDVSVKIPRNKLVVITGLSGSGKSSLAFDTIFAEGQRRYIESFSAYARQFLGSLSKPDVESIAGLSPVIAIEQKTTTKSPRSTVGTTTEIYDYLRLLFARVSKAYSFETGEQMSSHSTKEILNKVISLFDNQGVTILSPLVKGRKGHYRELFEKLAKQGFSKVRIDGEVLQLEKGMQIDRYKMHDIELVIDRIKVDSKSKSRLKSSIEDAVSKGDGAVLVLDEKLDSHFFSTHLSCPTSGISYNLPEPNNFSFNSPYGACPSCKGLGVSFSFDEKKVVPNKNISINKGAILPLGSKKSNFIFNKIAELAEQHGQDLNAKFESLDPSFVQELLFGDSLPDIESKFDGILSYLKQQTEYSSGAERRIQLYMKESECTSCNGERLNDISLHFKIGGKNISEIAKMDLADFSKWLATAPEHVALHHKIVADEILKEVKEKTDFLLDVGLYYLSLDRTSKTLSGGESQRIRLASQIGAKLVGVLYILDEPSIGLHPNDNTQLIEALQKLRDNGNSIIVVEHDKEIMEKADHVIDVGPFAGVNGGEIIDQGKAKELSNLNSLTYQYLKGIKVIEIPKKIRKGSGEKIILEGASGNNLKKVKLSIPLGVMTCVTGVSGSGKSSLIKGTLSPLLFNYVYKSSQVPLQYKSIKGLEFIDKVIEIDQSPIGRTPRSNPATYTGVFSDIRKLFSLLPQSKILGFSAGRFSFNVKGGRCEECKGAGVKVVEMNFLPDVFVGCKSCQGKRYNKEVLKVKYKGKNIFEVLDMSIEDSVVFFEAYPSISRKLNALNDVGLSYVKLGQPSTTLSGGEAQRIKLASELHKKDTGKTVYILDEPTTGLHFEDINVLLKVVNKIVDKGNTMIVIEHNTDVIKSADYVVDLGVEGGKKGGFILSQGTVKQLIKNKKSLTAKYVAKEFNN
ncbi:MAG: excinuclease ABC subunit A [Saprospiraceae bacterium]|jgi:excinuclease ABC subunit A